MIIFRQRHDLPKKAIYIERFSMKRDTHLIILDGAILQQYDSSYNIRNTLSR